MLENGTGVWVGPVGPPRCSRSGREWRGGESLATPSGVTRPDVLIHPEEVHWVVAVLQGDQAIIVRTVGSQSDQSRRPA